jgi:hypothetical protein
MPLEMVKYMIGRTFLNDIFIVLLCNAKRRTFHAILWMPTCTSYIDNHAYSDIHSVSSMKQNSTCRHIGNIILATSNPVFALTHQYYMLIDRSSIAHFIALISSTGVEPKIYHIPEENANHCTIEVMQMIYLLCLEANNKTLFSLKMYLRVNVLIVA